MSRISGIHFVDARIWKDIMRFERLEMQGANQTWFFKCPKTPNPPSTLNAPQSKCYGSAGVPHFSHSTQRYTPTAHQNKTKKMMHTISSLHAHKEVSCGLIPLRVLKSALA